jgi:DNA-binding CsgD family transcriptional regulator
MKDWLEVTGEAIGTIGNEGFADRMTNAINHIAAFEYCVVFGYLGTAQPLDLYDNFPKMKRKVFVEAYLEGPYLLDPFYLACMTPVSSGLYRMREIAPDRFFQAEYFRSYYVQTGLAEEVGYIIDLPGGAMIVISLMRSKKAFSAKEIRELGQYWPVVSAACKQHWRELSSDFGQDTNADSDPKLHKSVERALLRFGEGMLTPREREVVEFTLKGHSADAVGRILEISRGTVQIHRRNIYSKLHIRSQGELFSRFIKTLVGDSENDSS